MHMVPKIVVPLIVFAEMDAVLGHLFHDVIKRVYPQVTSMHGVLSALSQGGADPPDDAKLLLKTIDLAQSRSMGLSGAPVVIATCWPAHQVSAQLQRLISIEVDWDPIRIYTLARLLTL